MRQLTPSTINDSFKDTDLKLLASRVMEDNAMALAIEYRGEIVVTRMFLIELVAFLHGTHMRRDHPVLRDQPQAAKFRMELNTRDYYVMSREEYNASSFHRAIPEYRHVPALEYKV